MELLKLVLERLERFSHLLSVLVPGAAALLLLSLHHPGLVCDFWQIDYLEYQTKVFLIVICAFLLGWSISASFSMILIVLGALTSTGRPTPELSTKPWHNKNWRALLTAHLGTIAPRDMEQLYLPTFQAELDSANLFPEPERTQRIASANRKKADADQNDFEWATWWDYFHRKITLGGFTPDALLKTDINGSLQITSIVLLCAMPYTPILRHWWIIALCAAWLIRLILYLTSMWVRYRNPWSSFNQQLEYFEDMLPKELQRSDEKPKTAEQTGYPKE